MSDVDDDIKTARGDELAEGATGEGTGTPGPEKLAEGNPRGDGLAEGDGDPGSTPEADELAKGNPRGDGLADGA